MFLFYYYQGVIDMNTIIKPSATIRQNYNEISVREPMEASDNYTEWK